MNAIGNYLSLLQLKYDCETICSLIKHLQYDGVAAFGIIPYISLTATSTLELLYSSENEISLEPDVLQIHDVRLKLKVFENGYSKSKRMIINIDYLQDQVFKNMLKFDFMRNCDFTHDYRLCVFASVSLITNVFNCRTVMSVSCLHFGQNKGKFSSTVSSRTLRRVLF